MQRAALGAAVLLIVAGWLWWSRAGDSSGCPPALARAAPSTLDEASFLIAACSGTDIQARLRGAPLAALVSYRSADVPPAAWLEPTSTLYRELSALGFEYPDDMSFAMLSSAWHQTRGLPFDARSLAECLRAWNRKMRLWVESVAPGSSVPAPEFGCDTPDAIEQGRPLWPPL